MMYRFSLALAGLLAVASPASAQQFSPSYQFLKAVRDAEGNKVTEMLNQPGSYIVNSRDRTTGEGALHIVVKRGDATYLRFLLQKGADPNLKDGDGNTPAMLAVQTGFFEAIPILDRYKANFDVANSRGETPLIRAVQLRNLSLVRTLIDAGANPDQADVIAGLSARDYAMRDTRAPAIRAIFEKTPEKQQSQVAGPRP